MVFLLVYGFINQLSTTYAAIIILIMVLMPIVLLAARQYYLHSTKDADLSDYRAIKKDRKKAYEGRRVKILYDISAAESPEEKTSDCNLYFVGELYDDYLYRSSFKDFLGRNVSCIGIIKHIEERINPHAFYGEIEIIAIYA